MKSTLPISRSRSSSQTPTDDQIRTRAYELYLDCGRQDGQELEHWLRAERELREQPARLDVTLARQGGALGP